MAGKRNLKPSSHVGDGGHSLGVFAEAVDIDENVRCKLPFVQEPYLHSLRMLLDEAEMGVGQQVDGFGNECEGHCGV